MVTARRTWRATDGAATIRMPRGHPRLGAPQKIASRSEHGRTRFPGTNYGHAIILSAARVASVRRAMGANHTARTRDSCNQKLINCFRRTHLPSVIGRARTTLRRIHTWSEESARGGMLQRDSDVYDRSHSFSSPRFEIPSLQNALCNPCCRGLRRWRTDVVW